MYINCFEISRASYIFASVVGRIPWILNHFLGWRRRGFKSKLARNYVTFLGFWGGPSMPFHAIIGFQSRYFWDPRNYDKPVKTCQKGRPLLEYHLIGGFNPFEKYESNWESSPQGIGVKIKNKWNHHLVMHGEKHQWQIGCQHWAFFCWESLGFTNEIRKSRNPRAHPSRVFWKKHSLTNMCGFKPLFQQM